MNLFEVYKLWDIEPVRGLDTKLWDKDGIEYTDMYGGHAVISVGHCHPHYVGMLTNQLGKLGFYSNAVQNSLQKELAEKLGKVCGYEDYSLFLCNSGAEANENALKTASFHTGKSSPPVYPVPPAIATLIFLLVFIFFCRDYSSLPSSSLPFTL